MTFGCTEPQPWATVYVHLNKEDSQGTMTLTDNREERLRKTKDLECMMTHALASTTLTDFPSVSGHNTLLGFWPCTSCQQFNCCNCTNLFNFWLVREFLVEIHTARMVLWGVVFTPPIGYNRQPSAVNDPTATKIREKKSWKSHVWGSVQKRKTTSFSVLSCRFVRRACVDFHLNYYELYQESLHCHQLEEELDGWCQYWYLQNGTGLNCRSPDFWSRWCNVDNVSLKSERFLNDPVFPDLLRNPPIPYVSKVFCLRHMMAEIFLRKLIHLETDPFISIMFELRCTKFRIVHKTMVIPLKKPLDAFLSQNMGKMIISLFCCFPISVAMKSSLP